MTPLDRYPTKVFWSDEDEGFIAIAPDLPGCSAFGETKLEALDALARAMEAWVEAATKAKNPVPPPSKIQEDSTYSGRLLLRLPKSIHAQLAKAAEAEGVSLNQHICVVLAMHLGRASSMPSVRIVYAPDHPLVTATTAFISSTRSQTVSAQLVGQPISLTMIESSTHV